MKNIESEKRASRGGSRLSAARDCRASFRGRREPGDRLGGFGFRVLHRRKP
jgi:formylglycine-generating enzyme required for sulfatase activity